MVTTEFHLCGVSLDPSFGARKKDGLIEAHNLQCRDLRHGIGEAVAGAVSKRPL
ncbi:hypothetical protein GA0061102_100968 [Rhizobium miluonense]|uniref:Uncharacterized protein n=1 Tax=Rhizobium miluonense TaxID=411945 RepID=A0A1C3V6U2_9HYPH|nr:hypothetical protein GA0061102_100968 [Rhizobium miluonense]